MASRDIKTGPSHDRGGLIDLDGILNYAFMREQSAREQAKRPIGAGGHRLDFCPLPVLLFGATTLRVTSN